MSLKNRHSSDTNADYEILKAIENNGGKISRKKLHEVTDKTYKTLDNIIERLGENNDIIFIGNKAGKIKKNKRWKAVELTSKGEGRLYP